MRLEAFQEIVELSQSFDRLIMDPEHREPVPFLQRSLSEHGRSDVEILRVYANPDFFDSFEEIVENGAKWAHRFQRAVEKLKDRHDIYIKARDCEQRRKQKRLPPRVFVLPDRDMSDEDRYDEEHVRRRKSSAPKGGQTTRASANEARPRPPKFPPLGMPKKGVRRP